MQRSEPIDLAIGYSFGIAKTGGPGKLNERIARCIALESSLPSANRFVGVQWEIEEALRQIDPMRTRDFVVPAGKPPFYLADDLNGVHVQIGAEASASPEISRALTGISPYPAIADLFLYPDRAASYLNRLLQDRSFFRSFVGHILPTIYKRGTKWSVTHHVPDPMGSDVGPYQAELLNRLIFESLLPSLPKTKYVSTLDVVRRVLQEVEARRLTVARILIYGHPAHVERCRIQTLEAAWGMGLRINPDQVVIRRCCECENLPIDAPENWDPENAQNWIHSWEHWKEHEGLN